MSSKAQRRLHLIATVVWLLMVPLAIVTGWLFSLAFISACSIYANAASHWAAYEGTRAKEEAED